MATNDKVGLGYTPGNGNITSGDRVKGDLAKRVLVNPEFTMPRVRIKEVDHVEKKFKCCMCGQIYQKQAGNFFSGGPSILWKGNNGYLPFCKACTETLMEALISFYGGNEEHALRHICHIFDWYYSPLASAMTLAQVHVGKSRVSMYPSKLGTKNVAMKGTTYLDTVRDECEQSEKVQAADDLPSEAPEEEFVVTRDMLRFWGPGHTPSDYEFLQTQYEDWITRNECKTKAQEELFKMLAVAQLNVQIAQRSGNKVPEAMRAFQDLLGSSNLKPTQTNDNALADANTFGTLIKKWENEDPIPEPDPEWEDVDGIKKLIRTFFLGHLSKALHIKNDAADEYEKEIKKYTVKKPQAKQDDDDAPVAIFDSSSEGGGAS